MLDTLRAAKAWPCRCARPGSRPRRWIWPWTPMTGTSAATVAGPRSTRLCAINLACDYAAARQHGQGAEPGHRGAERPGGRPGRGPSGHPGGGQQPSPATSACTGRLDDARRLAEDTLRPDAAQARRDCTRSRWPARSTWPTASVSRRSRMRPKALERETVTRLTQVLGAEHPDTLVVPGQPGRDAARGWPGPGSEGAQGQSPGRPGPGAGARASRRDRLREGQRINRDLEPNNI